MSDADRPPTTRERRASQRVPIEMWVEEVAEDTQVFRRAGNLSRGGLYLDKTIPIPMGTVVTLRFTLPGDDAQVEVRGEIVSIDPEAELGMGVRFLSPTSETQARIDAYLARALTPVALPVVR
jgi:type IV pilus assembly protein PilZ